MTSEENHYKIIFNESRENWEKFVSTSPQRSVFVFTAFLDSLETDYILVTCYEKNRLVAGAVILMDESGRPFKSSYPFTMYQGLLLMDNSHLEAHKRIAYELRLTEYFIGKLIDHYQSCSFCQNWRFIDMRPFQWYNYHGPAKGLFKIDLRYTGILDLGKYKNFAAYWPTIRKVRRQEYSKAQKIFEIITSADELILDDLHAKTFHRQGLERSQEESSLVKSITRHAIAHNYGTLKMARLDGEVVSAILYLFDDRTAYYLFGANHPKYRKTGSGTLLVGEMIKDAFAKGLQEVDFVGVNSPHRGDYKIGFNADLKPYFVASIG